MKLQLALDELTLVDSLLLVEKVKDYIDIIEIGTPLVMREGMRAVREMKRYFPNKEILADLKIMDGGYFEAKMAFEAGADYATVLGVTDILTAKASIEAAYKHGKQIVVDMICIQDLPSKIREMEEIKAHYVAVHTGADQQAAGRQPLDDLKLMKKHVKEAKIAVAGGINRHTVDLYVAHQPDVIIVGSGITNAEDPVAEAMAIKNAMVKGGKNGEPKKSLINDYSRA
ncbi:3-hexulose-6-phosphate synthase [Bacillus sp. FJAT-50079]|uniref:3-hexulose-6-phosphate synthase n=1 Tax=Bacillus sp. FJAT-50079 TaxID=2833577 RepID=UPI001BC9C28C|nr:3-hexulose-6-phosphate synthase [Bacillus sp. FJAT-50079]MBS4206614.1 3-hexulose-6-phosphate synthase [Bacillus sp. FJAT-50079]